MSKYYPLIQASPESLPPRDRMLRAVLSKQSYNTIVEDKDRERIDKAIDILLAPDLLDRCVKEAHKWIESEDETIKVIHICAAGRLVKNAQIASFNLNVNSESGAGKDHVVKNTLRILPRDQYIKRTRISATVFTYWKANDKEWTWDKKILYLEDISNSVLNSPVFKVMCSSGSETTVVKDQRAIDLTVKGKPVIIVTTAETKGNKENRRRMPVIELDESHDQTRAIMLRAAKMAASGEKQEDDELLRFALSLPFRCEVVIPFSEHIAGFFPINVSIRTHFNRFLDYIRASAAFHQFQRERDEKDRVIATGQDYDLARGVLLKMTSNPLMLALNRKERKLLDYMRESKAELTVADIYRGFQEWAERKNLHNALRRLSQDGFLIQDETEVKGKQAETFRCADIEVSEIPKWENIDLVTKPTIPTTPTKPTIPTTANGSLNRSGRYGRYGYRKNEVDTKLSVEEVDFK